MSFYDQISRYYDDIFPLNEQKLLFLKKSFQNKNTLLDIACATGAYVNKLTIQGFDVTGIDLDDNMIKIAKIKYPLNNFLVMDMMDIDQLEMYDGIYCIGNSLVHLRNEEQITKAISVMFNDLNLNGVLVLQIINYDRIINQNINHLPTIKNEKIEFIRNYESDKEIIKFNTELKVNNKKYFNSVNLYPLRKSALVTILETAGFRNIECFNGFQEKPFDEENSMALVVKAVK